VRADGYTIERTALGPTLLWQVCRLNEPARVHPEAILPVLIPEMARQLVEHAAEKGLTVDWPTVVWSVEVSDIPNNHHVVPRSWVAP
jgi:hypothetical protein